MSSQSDEGQVVSTGLTARVADSYGVNPHEHKPSQNPFVPDEAEEEQAETGGVDVDDEGRADSSPGNSSSTSAGGTKSSGPKTDSGSTPAQSAGNRSARALKGSSSASSTGTGRSAQSSGRKADG